MMFVLSVSLVPSIRGRRALSVMLGQVEIAIAGLDTVKALECEIVELCSLRRDLICYR